MDFQLALSSWFISPLVLLGGLAAGLVVHTILHVIARRAAASTPFLIDDLLVKWFRQPVRLGLVLMGMLLARKFYPLPEHLRPEADHIFAILWIAVIAWFIVSAANLGEDLMLLRFDLTKRDNLRAREMVTKLKVFKRIVVVLVIIIALAAALMTFDSVRAIGTSLLASAGLAGIVLGFSAQKTIATIFAGVQIALTQPIRIDDVVVVEGEWGRIEEITFTYVVIAVWDQRRLILPITYFIDNPIQNWTRTRADILGTVFLYTDYTVDLEGLRTELKRIVKEEADGLWDGRLAILQVTEAKEQTLELRALVSAPSGPKAWDLRCQVRERLIEYLRREQPEALPRVRIEDRRLNGKDADASPTLSEKETGPE